MSKRPDDNHVRQTLMAFADGELDAAQSAAALDYLVAHPEWLKVLRDQQRLRLAASRVVRERTPALPADARQRIAALAAANSAADGAGAGRAKAGDDGAGGPVAIVAARRRVAWLPTAAAAGVALVVGLAVGALVPRRGETPLAVVTGPTSPSGVPLVLAAAVTRVHVDCSRFPLDHHAGPFPTTAPFDALAADVRWAFRRAAPFPDLSGVGYEFVGAGPCARPLSNTVHLLHRSTAAGSNATLSVFVQPDVGQIDVPDGEARAMAPAGSPHPAYVWRTDAAVYYLVADDAGSADRARDALLLAMSR